MLLLVFSVQLDWFPVYGAVSATELGSWAALRDGATRLVLPVATLTLAGAGSTFLVARSAMVTELQEDYVFMARAKGLNERQVRRHARRNALLPVSTAALLGFSTLISAATVVESIFSYPGLGSLAFDSVLAVVATTRVGRVRRRHPARRFTRCSRRRGPGGRTPGRAGR